MAAAACAAGLPPGILFAPEDELAVEYYLLPRLLGWQLQIDGLVLDDDPLSASPWELLERNGRKEEAFFFAEGQARCGKGTRQKRTCAGGGWWEGQKTCAEGDATPVPGGGGNVAAWRKKALNFHGGCDGKKGSTGWVMHEYAVTAPEDLARSPLRLYHIRRSSYGRKQNGGMEVPRALGLPAGFIFAPEDGDVVAHYLLPRILGQPLPLDGLILDDDPLSARPWELLQRNGCKDDAFFFALGQAKSSKGSRQKRTCAGGGFWNGERKCADGEKLRVPGPGGAEVAWRKKSLSFQEGGEKGSTGWVMHEYAITAPDHLADSQLRLYRIRFSGHGKKRKRGDEDPCADEAAPTAVRLRVAEDALLDFSTSQPSTEPICSSSVVTTDADQHATAVTVPANQDFTPGIAVGTSWDNFDTSWDNFDIDELLRSIADSPSTDPCVLPPVTDPGACLDADAASSSFFSQTVAAASPYNGVGAGLVAPSAPAMYRGCMEPADSFFFTVPNQSYAAC
ncbi:hypothetical protein BAE44_0012243 [Dichanthelium oligosanthes]|uniref:NAC domain-containing protein n=1 Tax=Dichanthelium oligosanthes TaxID=888268 RepID=A0A1E5VNS9_9POAL|nr:hypothetical protein BAE44_0012243 [Dichanthelium oligosanthes]